MIPEESTNAVDAALAALNNLAADDEADLPQPDRRAAALSYLAISRSGGLWLSDLPAYIQILELGIDVLLGESQVLDNGNKKKDQYISALRDVIGLAGTPAKPTKMSDVAQSAPHVSLIRALACVVLRAPESTLQAAAASSIALFTECANGEHRDNDARAKARERHERIVTEAAVAGSFAFCVFNLFAQSTYVPSAFAGSLVEVLFGGIEGEARDTVLAALCSISSVKGNEQALLDSMVAPYLCALLKHLGKADEGAGAEIALEALWNMVEMAGADPVGAQLTDDSAKDITAALQSVSANHQSKISRELRNDLLSVITLLVDSPEFTQHAIVSRSTYRIAVVMADPGERAAGCADRDGDRGRPAPWTIHPGPEPRGL